MERIVDLDAAAAEIERRYGEWAGAGLKVGATTWREEAAEWPQSLETERDRVRDPDSVGVSIVGAEGAEAEITLFRGGWADVGFFSERTGWEAVFECPAIRSPAQFGAVLDAVTTRAFGTGSAGSAATPTTRQ
ncbi:hypothetical protein NMG29_39505 [Streptomyces cocklensis]|uniref:Uncharacterized protein n=1 Tax=Actinacidiphila cocklensis TaxID=887465 RepID=A0A9W4DZN2_9ACTN|nr:hypothetical protein [Actinacidiphila cocklensis]MDD1064163.1 hypothetical protein [Actinacidiphila cocklensis]CAG6398297.1 conserved hypothetical protein [Actinacidiphila cocklensis]